MSLKVSKFFLFDDYSTCYKPADGSKENISESLINNPSNIEKKYLRLFRFMLLFLMSSWVFSMTCQFDIFNM